MEIRRAGEEDVAGIVALVERAYSRYVPRMGRRPRPMDSDYPELVARGEVAVAVDGIRVVGVIVSAERSDHLFVDNVAVDPERQGEGIGRELLELAERSAREAGLSEVRLFTNAAMTENLRMYPYLGYEEVGRETQGEFHVVHFSKSLGPRA